MITRHRPQAEQPPPGWPMAQHASLPLMNPQVVAAIIAASVSALTLVGTLAAQYFGRRATSRDTEKSFEEQGKQLDRTLAEQRKQLDRTLAEQRKQLDRTLAEQRTRTLNERFATAAGQLGSDKPPAVRLAGVYAMAGLADDWEENRQTCVDVLCAYLRMPYEPDPGEQAPAPARLAFRADREVRHTVIRIITAHFRDGAARSWQGLNLDFTGVVFDGGEFYLARFPSGTIRFNGAEFSSSDAYFNSVKFSGATVWFTNAKFSGGTVYCRYAEFSGGQIDFSNAEFSGGTVRFGDTKFSGATVWFTNAKFSGGTVSFSRVKFSGGTTAFFEAEFSGGQVDFSNAEFSGGTVRFGGARFSGGTIRFENATFSRGEVDFGAAAVPGSELGYDSDPFGRADSTSFISTAIFSGGVVDFTGAQFSGGTVDFTTTNVPSVVTTYFPSAFSGGTVDLSRPGDWSVPPRFAWAGTPPPGVKLPKKEDQSQV